MVVLIIVGVGIKEEYISKTDSLLKHIVAFHNMENVVIPCGPRVKGFVYNNQFHYSYLEEVG